MKPTPARGLGRGLSALMGEGAGFSEKPAFQNTSLSSAAMAAPATANAAVSLPQVIDVPAPSDKLPVAALVAGKYQPRRHFEAEALAELTDSIEKHGVMQPIVVRAIAAGKYEIIAGERRFRAAKLANLAEVPVIVRDVNDSEALELALIENIQRADLNPLEEAAGYQRLMDEFGYTQEKLAPIVGKSRSHIANLLRLLKLPDSIKTRIDTGALTMGHARALLMATDPEALAQKIIEIGLSVRQAEEMAKGGAALSPSPVAEGQGARAPKETSAYDRKPAHRGGAAKSEDVLQLEAMLSDNLGLAVGITTLSGQAGEVVIRYDTLGQLDEILRRLGGSI
jgi:ParB family chromosome partitioning protein